MEAIYQQFRALEKKSLFVSYLFDSPIIAKVKFDYPDKQSESYKPFHSTCYYYELIRIMTTQPHEKAN